MYRDRHIHFFKNTTRIFVLRVSSYIKKSLVSRLKAKVLTMNAACGFRSEANEAMDLAH